MKTLTIKLSPSSSSFVFVFFFLGCIKFSGALSAQVSIYYSGKEAFIRAEKDLWVFDVHSLMPGETNIVFDMSVVSVSGDSVLYYQSAPFVIRNGRQEIIISSSFRNITRYFNNALSRELSRTGLFSNGSYRLCVNTTDLSSSLQFGENCYKFSIDDKLHVQSNSKAQNQNFSFSGSAEFQVQASNVPSPFGNIPSSYFQTHIRPQVVIYDLPFTGDIFLGTQSSMSQQSFDNFSIGFDGNLFRNILKGKLEKKIKAEMQNQLPDIQLKNDLLHKLNDIENTFQNPEVIKELKLLDSLDNLKKTLADLQNKSNSIELDTAFNHRLNGFDRMELENQINKLKWLEDKRSGYEKLIERKRQIEKLAKQHNLMDSLGNKIPINIPDIVSTDLQSGLYKSLKKNNLLRKIDKLAFGINKLQFGASSPSWSEFSLKGQRVNGVNIEYSYQNIHFNFVYGKAREGVFGNVIQSSYDRLALGLEMGYGSKHKNFIFIQFTHFDDDTNSIQPRDSVHFYYNTPKQAYTLGLQGGVSFFKERLRFSGELSGSQYISDKSSNLDSALLNNTPTVNEKDWFRNIIFQRNGSLRTHIDYAFLLKAELVAFKGKTKFIYSSRRVGNGYKNLGVPFMPVDQFINEVKVQQQILKGRIKFSILARYIYDNLSGNKIVRNSRLNYGGDLVLSFPKLPQVRILVQPFSQSNDSINYDFFNASALLSHQYKVGKNNWISTVSYLYQNANSNLNTLNYSIHQIHANQQFVVSNTSTILSSLSYLNQQMHDTSNLNMYSVLVGGNIQLLKRFNISIGASVNSNNNRWGGGGYSQIGFKFLKVFEFTARLDYNQITPQLLFQTEIPNEQIIFRTTLVTRW